MEGAYEEVINFIAGGTTPNKLVDFRSSEAAKARVSELTGRKKASALSVDEELELERYLQLEHLMRLAKARAHQHLAV